MNLKPALAAAAFLLLAPSLSPLAAETVTTPQAVCAELPQSMRAACMAAGELLSAPVRPALSDPAISVMLTAGEGALAARYVFRDQVVEDGSSIDCPGIDAIFLPAGQPIGLMVTAMDTIYTLTIPGLVDGIDLVPGRVNELVIETPQETGAVRGELKEDEKAPPQEVIVHITDSSEPFVSKVLCKDR